MKFDGPVGDITAAAHDVWDVAAYLHSAMVLVLLLCCALAVRYWIGTRGAAGSEPKDVERPGALDSEPAQARIAAPSSPPSGRPMLREAALVVALMALLGLVYGFAIRRGQTGYGGTNMYEAHRMQCGTPDCRRDDATCGAALNASTAARLGLDGNGAAADGNMCCRDLMLRMLIDVGDWLDRNKIEWYVTYGTLLGATRDGSVIRWTDDVDITIPSRTGLEALRQQSDMPYRFGHYGVSMLRGCADYPGVPTKLPHHPSGNGAHMWIGDPPALHLVSCEGDLCEERADPSARHIPPKSTLIPNWAYVGRTAYYFMDVYSAPDEPFLLDPACAAFSTASHPPSKERVVIGGRSFPTHRHVKRCLELWYGKDFMTPTIEHVSDYTVS